MTDVLFEDLYQEWFDEDEPTRKDELEGLVVQRLDKAWESRQRVNRILVLTTRS